MLCVVVAVAVASQDPRAWSRDSSLARGLTRCRKIPAGRGSAAAASTAGTDDDACDLCCAARAVRTPWRATTGDQTATAAQQKGSMCYDNNCNVFEILFVVVDWCGGHCSCSWSVRAHVCVHVRVRVCVIAFVVRCFVQAMVSNQRTTQPAAAGQQAATRFGCCLVGSCRSLIYNDCSSAPTSRSFVPVREYFR